LASVSRATAKAKAKVKGSADEEGRSRDIVPCDFQPVAGIDVPADRAFRERSRWSGYEL